ncbi:inner membrane protein YpjD, partial [Pseudomonas aeruginosa]
MLPSHIAAGLYLGTAAYPGACVSPRTAPGPPLLLLFGLLALVAHAFGLYQPLLTPAGLVLDFFNAARLLAAAEILLTLLATLRIPVENLLLRLFPLGA